MEQINLFDRKVTSEPTGSQLRNKGISKAVSHANDVHPEPEKWIDQAERFIKRWIKSDVPFTVEQAVEASWQVIPQPPTSKAWAGVILRLKRQGHVKALGIVKATKATSHAGYITQWIKC